MTWNLVSIFILIAIAIERVFGVVVAIESTVIAALSDAGFAAATYRVGIAPRGSESRSDEFAAAIQVVIRESSLLLPLSRIF